MGLKLGKVGKKTSKKLGKMTFKLGKFFKKLAPASIIPI